MPALSGITAVRPTSSTVTKQVVYGETIAVGQTLYQDSTNDRWKLADCNATAATAAIKGIAITPGVDGGYGIVATSGNVQLVGTTMAKGETYHVGQTPGTIVPDADLTTNDYVSRVGTAASATELALSILATGIQHA